MRVLHLPTNVASQISVSVRGLRQIGVEARGLVDSNLYRSCTGTETLRELPVKGFRRRALGRASQYAQILRGVLWADVVHWHGTWGLRSAIDLRLARWLGKKRVVEFWGSEIRVPEIEAAANPYYSQAYRGGYEYRLAESADASLARQLPFARCGATAITSRGLRPHLRRDLFRGDFVLEGRVCLEDFPATYPDTGRSNPLVLHSSTAPICKGTPAVLQAVEEARKDRVFQFQFVHATPLTESRDLVRRCDIFLDQFVVGYFGLAAIEAMAFGKPVVCFIKPSLIGAYPEGLPIVNATQETLACVLGRLIDDGVLRHELGVRGRRYVEQHHSANHAAEALREIYEKV